MSSDVESPPAFKEKSPETSWCSMPKRYVQALLGFLALFILHWMRTSFDIAMDNILYKRISSHDNENAPPWTTFEVVVMYSIHTWGYAVAQIPGALLTIMFSSHRVLPVSLAMATIFHIILPFTLNSSAPSIIIIRLLQGIAEGPIYPALVAMWKHWAPPSERTTLFSIVLCGSFFGNVAGQPFNMALVENFGEVACFLISSVSGIIWCLLWMTQTYESPLNHPHISQHELKYLEDNVEPDCRVKVTVSSIPWLAILRSFPVWAICLANLCYSSAILVLRLVLQHEMHYIMPEIFLPDIIMGVIVSLSGFFADFLINRVHLSTSLVRKFYCSAAFILNGVAFLVVRYHVYESIHTVIFANLACGFLGLAAIGFLVNCLDLSPCYGSVVMALCQIFGFLSDNIMYYVILMHFRLPDIFDTIISLSFIGALAYAFFGSGKSQLWAKPKTTCTAARTAEEDDLSRCTYYSYPDDGDSVELIINRHSL